MRRSSHNRTRGPLGVGAGALVALLCVACGSSVSTTQSSAPAAKSTTSRSTSTTTTSSATSTSSSTSTAALPGAGKPTVTIGDKNYTEQFVLGELYSQALQAQGFSVQLNQNIGPTDVTMQAIKAGSLAMYPEYLNVFNTSVAKYSRAFRSRAGAYRAAERYALAQGLTLLDPTPFSDTGGIAVTVGWAQANHVSSLPDVARLAAAMTIGGPAETQPSTPGMAEVERTYGFTPKAFTPLAVGAQYSALNAGTVQAAEVQTTDGQLASGDYRMLGDPARLYGWGNVVPVVSDQVLAAEGPAFQATIDHVDSHLTMQVIRELNQEVDVAGQTPAAVAKQFLETHNLLTPSTATSSGGASLG
jgi:osmoprotectant transport system substrate-binding protein